VGSGVVYGCGWYFTSRHHHHRRPAGRPGSRRPGRSRLGLEIVSRLLHSPREDMRTLIGVAAATAWSATPVVAAALAALTAAVAWSSRSVLIRKRKKMK
jgi:hypothetical protein